LNSISGASDSTVSAPSSGQLLTYNGSSWTNSTLSLPNQTSYIWGFNLDLTAHTFTNSTQVGSYYMFDLFALSAYSVFVNSSDWTVTNAWTMTYTGASSQTFWLAMSYTNVAGTGLNIIVCLNGTIIYASYMGTVAGQQSSFVTQPITFTTNSTLNIGCSASFQTIQNPSIDVSQVAGILNSPTLYANPGTLQSKYFQCFANNISLTCSTIFAQSNRLDLTNMTAVITNDATAFTKT